MILSADYAMSAQPVIPAGQLPTLDRRKITMGYDVRKDSNHPISTHDDPIEQGRRERERFGAGNQLPQQWWESNDDHQRRIHGK